MTQVAPDLLPYIPAIVLLMGVFAGAFVSSFAGFAFAPIAGVALLYFYPYKTVVPLLMLCSVLVQVTTLIYLRRSVIWKSVGPMLAGGAAGVSLAILLFAGINARAFQTGFGLFLAIYSLFMLWRPHLMLKDVSTPARDIVVGFAGGVIGGFTAMPGAVPIIYCDLRGCSKEVQRATVQPFILAMQVLAITLFFVHGDIGDEVIGGLLLATPALAAGVAVGLLLFGRVPDARFRQAVLGLLLITGIALAF